MNVEIKFQNVPQETRATAIVVVYDSAGTVKEEKTVSGNDKKVDVVVTFGDRIAIERFVPEPIVDYAQSAGVPPIHVEPANPRRV